MSEGKVVAIMQPYFLPYIGYWQLIAAADVFVVYDNIEFTKKGWINRNRYLSNGKDQFFSLPLKKGSDYQNICERRISADFLKERVKILRRVKSAYQKAPFSLNGLEVLESCLSYEDLNLFNFIYNSMIQVNKFLDIKSEVVVSSNLSINHSLKKEERVLEICKYLGATKYINPIGGKDLYNEDRFLSNGIEIRFQKVISPSYPQFNHDFVPQLSILDCIMFNKKDAVKEMLYNFELV